MKFTKVIFLILGIALLQNCNSAKKTAEVAQPEPEVATTTEAPRGPRGQRGNREEMMAQRQQQQEELVAALNLSDPQRVKFDEINEKYREKSRTLRENNQEDRMAMMQEMRKLRAEQNDEIKGILTAEQFEIYQKKMEERRAQRGPRGGGNNGN